MRDGRELWILDFEKREVTRFSMPAARRFAWLLELPWRGPLINNSCGTAP
jgi:hypothetical protein